jgi:5-methylcytosine-specific restriction endonuclease McrA
MLTMSRAVWKRDKGTCQRCGAKANDGAIMHIHHIVSFAVKELRTETGNLVLLCIGCHHFVHSAANTGREFVKER